MTNTCRPFMRLDECNLKNKYRRILLIVFGGDPNDQYLPIAFGFVEMKSKYLWSWFITLIITHIGEHRWWLIYFKAREENI